MLKSGSQKLLIISHDYNDFVKDLTETIQPHLQSVNVCVRYNYLAELLSYLPIDNYKTYSYRRHVDMPDNHPTIQIYLTRFIYGPSDAQYKKIGAPHYKSVVNTISKNHIDFDLIHSHFIWSSGYAGARLKEEYGVPLVVTAHGYDIYSLPFKDQEWREKIEYVLNTADQIITVSQSNHRCIDKLNVSTPVTVIPNGFRSDLFFPRDPAECRRALNLPQNKKIILTVGNLLPVKGQKYLIEALHTIRSYREDVLCVIVGVGELRTALEHQIRSLGLEEYVMFAGGKPHNEIPLWMNACDIFVLPSLNEGNPTVMFEAIGCGKPFVGTRVGGVPEVITSDRYGLVVDPADPGDLAEKVLMALDREWDQDVILRHADRYTWEKIADEVLKVYSTTECT